MRSESGKSLVPRVPGAGATPLWMFLRPSAMQTFEVFVREGLSAVKHLADHTPPRPLHSGIFICYLFLRSCGEKASVM